MSLFGFILNFSGVSLWSLIDFILNLAGLLLWLNWRAAARPVRSPGGLSLLSTLRPAGPARPRVHQWAGLPILLLVRALFYWQAGPPIHWNPQLPLGPVTLSFRSDYLGRMLLFSVLSFVVALGVCYLYLLFLSCINARVSDSDPMQRLLRSWLGGMEKWPVTLKLLVPLAVATIAWWLLCLLLLHARLVPANSTARVLGQGAVIGLGGYLMLKFLIAAILILHLLNSYVYLGEFALWNFVNATARRLLRPLQWLPVRLGKVDLTPVIAIIVVMVAADFGQRGLNRLYHGLL